MFKTSDPFTFATNGPLQGADKVVIGQFSAEYQVTHYDDVQLASGTTEAGVENDGSRQYLLNCTQRIKIYNASGTSLRPQHDLTSYENYPAMLNTSVQVLSQSGLTVELVEYSPQTVNTQIQTSGTTGSSTGQTSGSSTSNTVGSSTSETNSFGVSVGFFGDLPTGSVSAEHSSTTSHEKSNTVSNESSRSSSAESSSSSAMSIKDWGAYCLVNPVTSGTTWTFGQEYPWDAVTSRKTTGAVNPMNSNQVQLVVPINQAVRLYDGVSLYPPSHLSMFGVNFVMKTQWKVTVANTGSDVVGLTHIINYFSGSHSLPPGASIASIYLDSAPSTLSVASPGSLSSDLDLGVLGLAPLTAANSPAIVGFLPAKFVTKPAPYGTGSAPTAFRVFSSANNLRVTDTTTYPASGPAGAGFSTSETALNANLTGSVNKLKMSLLFKVVDATTNYTLYIKHWKTSAAGIALSIVINGDLDTTLVKYVDALESEGGENNLLAIGLRNLDVTSADFHDYLTLGLNSIDIAITPIGGTGPAGYQMRAVSIEAS